MMAQAGVATYTMEAFVQDVKDIFKTERDPHKQAKAVAAHMKELLAVPGWLEEKLQLPEEGGYGRFDLYLDEDSGHPGNGWYLMASIQKPGQDNLPHDHGVTWVVYGVYQGAIRQRKWRWAFPGEGVSQAQIVEHGSFVQRDGTVAYFMPGEIHDTLNVVEGRSLVVRLESQKLDRVTRFQYNPETGSMAVMER
jgi:predicted metal-dependent enzyme (double-stranded beta helix superfamily)